MATRITLNRVQRITIRDSESAVLLKRIGVRQPAEVTADPAFAITASSVDAADRILAEAGVSGERPMLGVAVRPWSAERNMIAPIAEMVDILRNEFEVVFIPMQAPGDVELSERIAARAETGIVLKKTMSPAQAVAVVGQMSGMVAMRLHALVFAAMGGVPLLALSYDPKVDSLMARLGQGSSTIDLDSFLPKEAAGLVLANMLFEGPARRAAIRSRAEDMANLALVNVDRALELVG